ncbi:unnamed protein product [Lactuca virosa]|uniref:Alpha 1,4-glycosyltransferase domain-containing protein n=1 Tax=Lactuca virosa TaxID=75947 RepID=A0AAU9LUW9_9ASTR|nr:unnamed protein product [Lactuca virosa]
MIKTYSLKRAEQRRLSLSRCARFHVLSAISIAAIFFTYILITTHTLPSNYHPIHTLPLTISPIHPPLLNNPTFIVRHVKLTSYSIHKPIRMFKEDAQKTVLEDDHKPSVSLFNHTRKEKINGFKEKLPEFDILKSTPLTRRFKNRVQEFFKDGCKVRFFMTWISPSLRVFGDREVLAVDALLKSNPKSCLMILSNTMDSVYGIGILKPFTDRGFRVQAITPDLEFLFKNTPAQSWLDHIKNGKTETGTIPLAQNLSNLIRLAILYKYGGVYVDTDFVILKDFSSLRNSIGAQSTATSGNWTRLNNAVLIFDKNHPLLYKFMEEFALTFNGNKWGYNGPYLVSRVVQREATTLELNFTVLPPKAFYPVDWTRIGGYFTPPVNRKHLRWIEAKLGQLCSSSYGVHLWNKQSRGLRIEDGSIIARLILDHCVICNTK